jgi:hypothetical protein
LIVTLHQRISEDFGLTLKIPELFKYVTCASQAHMIDKLREPQEKITLSSLDILEQLQAGSMDLETAKKLLNLA